MSEHAHMWTYWRDKHGLVEALEFDYPNTLKANSALQMALHNIRANEALINKIMGDLSDEEENNG